MYLLLDDANTILLIAHECTPHEHGWKVNKNMVVNLPNAHCVEIDEVPSHVIARKYRYMDGAFTISPYWDEPVNETKVLKEEVNKLTAELDKVTFEVRGTDPSTMPLEEYRKYLRNKNNDLLAEFLLKNPLKWTNGKTYGATEEDQSLMLNNYNGWKMFNQMGIPIKLEWNAANEGCTEWAEEEYLALMGAIYTYAKKMLKLCQWYKVQIIKAMTRIDIESIELIYSVEKADEIIEMLQTTTEEGAN